MANLMFKYGSFANLPDKVAGQILVTTDEKAMYVDLPNTAVAGGVERLRLGQTIVYPTWDDFNKTETLPPHSPEAFYYIESENALLKYIGYSVDENGVVSGGSWKQINSVSDLEADISDIEDAIAALNQHVTTSEAAIESLQKAVAEEKTRAEAKEGELANAIDAEKTRAETKEGELANAIATLESNKATVEALNQEINRATGVEAGLQAAIDAINNTDTGLAGRVTKLEGTVGDANGGLVKDVADLKDLTSTHDQDITNLENADKAINNRIDGIDGRTTALENVVGDADGGLVKDVADLKTVVGDKDSGLVKDVDTLEGLVADLESNKATVSQLNEVDQRLSGRIDNLDNVVGDSTKGLVKKTNDLETKVGSEVVTGGSLSANINNIKDTLSTINQTLGNKADITYVDEQISTKLAEVDGMKFKGSIKSLSDLPTTGVEAGWTYIIEETFKAGDVDYYAGDLIIAKADQGASETYGSGWDHVKTGYWKDQDPTLEINTGTVGGAQIYLRDMTGTTRGSVEVVGNGVDVAVQGGNLNITLAWGQF